MAAAGARQRACKRAADGLIRLPPPSICLEQVESYAFLAARCLLTESRSGCRLLLSTTEVVPRAGIYDITVIAAEGPCRRVIVRPCREYQGQTNAQPVYIGIHDMDGQNTHVRVRHEVA